jgi:3alpha(or 20beta)-hydroxysteroid dehydrogenase
LGSLDGKVALITGAARGQGEAEARLFAAEGAKVVIGDVRDDVGEALAKDLGDATVYQHLDVSRADEWDAAVAATTGQFGSLDILVNNAGILFTGLIEDTTLDDYMRIVNVNQVGCWLGMKTAVAAMKERGGSIVNISSTGGLKGIRGMSAYVSSKFAVRGMTKVAALEFGQYGIRVNSVHPGAVDTDMVREMPGRGENPGLRTMPIARSGTAEEIANLVLFLASDASSYCTGAEFVADGGSLAG